MNQTFEVVAIGRLVESATNPRRHFGEQGLAELTRSVADHGILNPLLVRPKPKKSILEVVCGARRFRAAQAAGLTEVPVRIEPLSDNAVLEIQVIENLQREDVHPLDEALGYRALLETGTHDVASVASRVGKSESYVYQRLKLTDLIEPAQKAFWAEKITAGHAILIARLQPADQKRALQTCADRWDSVISVRRLGEWIHQLLLALSGAPWKKDDAELVPAAGSCNDCPKRTGNAPQLFPEVKARDVCTDPACYQGKLAAHIARRQAEYAARGENLLVLKQGWVSGGGPTPKGVIDNYHFTTIAGKDKPCGSARPGIVAHGSEQVGHVLTVCIDPNCKQHRGQSSSSGAYRRTAAEIAREKAKKLAEQQRLETLRRARVQMVEAVTELGPSELHLIAMVQVRSLDADNSRRFCQELGLDVQPDKNRYRDYRQALRAWVSGLDGLELHRGMVNLALFTLSPSVSWISADEFNAVATARGVNGKAIAKQVEAEAKAARAKAKPRTKPAGKKRTRKAA